MGSFNVFQRMMAGGAIIALTLVLILTACSHAPTDKFDVYVKQSEDVEKFDTVETTLTVTPEKAALHKQYQIVQNVAVPYVPEYRIGPGDIIEIVYYIKYQRTEEDYRLEVQDKISINFPYHPQYSTTVLIRTDGKITVPIVGEVSAESLTPEELAELLNKKYSEFLQNPSITIALEAFNMKIEEMKKAITTAPRGQSKIAPVAPDGRISFPIIGSVHAEGLTLLQFEKLINDKYARVVRNLNANIILLEIHHQRFYILGEVEKPGMYEMTSRTTLLDALAMAEGLTNKASVKDIVLFRNDGLERPIASKVNVGAMLKKGYTFANIQLKPADIIYVSKTTLDTIDDIIEKVFTKGVWSVMPFNTNFSWGEKDLGGDGGNND